MKTKVDGRAFHHGNGHKTTNREVAEVFDTIAAGGAQPRLRNVTGSCRFDIAGAGTYRIDVKDGAPTVTHNASDMAPADCVVTLTAEDFLRVARREGYLNAFAGFLQGRVALSGDISLAATLLLGYTPERAGSQAR